jgi:hypothetical protein
LIKLKDGKITLLFNDEGMQIELYDSESAITFAHITLDKKETLQALSRLAHTTCSIELHGLKNINKKLQIEHITFPMPVCDYTEKKKIAFDLAKKFCAKNKPGWIPSEYFNSQDSFFYKKGVCMARCTIRRWV